MCFLFAAVRILPILYGIHDNKSTMKGCPAVLLDQNNDTVSMFRNYTQMLSSRRRCLVHWNETSCDLQIKFQSNVTKSISEPHEICLSNSSSRTVHGEFY